MFKIFSSSYHPQPSHPLMVAGMAGLLTVDNILSYEHCPRWHCKGGRYKPSESGTQPCRPESSGRGSRTPPRALRYFGRRRRFSAPVWFWKRVCASSSPCRTYRTQWSSHQNPPPAPAAGRRADFGRGSVSRNALSSPGWKLVGGSRTGSNNPGARFLQRHPRLSTDTPGNRPSPESLSGTRWWSWDFGACWACYSS